MHEHGQTCVNGSNSLSSFHFFQRKTLLNQAMQLKLPKTYQKHSPGATRLTVPILTMHGDRTLWICLWLFLSLLVSCKIISISCVIIIIIFSVSWISYILEKKNYKCHFPQLRSFCFTVIVLDTYLVHIATEKLILFLQSLYEALWSNDTCFLLLRTYLHKGTMNGWLHYHGWKVKKHIYFPQ